MIEVVLASSSGFCFGVRRAVEQVETLLSEGGGAPVVSVGPLIHNPQEVERLRAAGVEPVEEERVERDQHVVLRTHGVTAAQRARLTARGPVLDATCPHVIACQDRARDMAAAGYAVLIVGDAGHPETDSVLSHAALGRADPGEGPPALIAPDAASVAWEDLKPARRAAVLAQTTCEAARFVEVGAACMSRFAEVRAFNTICPATTTRQREARALARDCDLVLVIGGFQSANTRRLATICAEIQPRTFQVEQAGDVDPRWLEGVQRVAITAGASTPDRIIQDVITRVVQERG